MESITEIFHIDWKMLVAQTVNFCLVAFVLWKFIWKPVASTLEERQKKIMESLRLSQESGQKMSEATREAQELIQKARFESSKIIEKASADAADLRKEELGRSKEEANKIIEAGKKALLAEKENIITEIRKEAADLVIRASGSVLKGLSSPEISQQVVKNALNAIEEEK